MWKHEEEWASDILDEAWQNFKQVDNDNDLVKDNHTISLINSLVRAHRFPDAISVARETSGKDYIKLTGYIAARMFQTDQQSAEVLLAEVEHYAEFQASQIGASGLAAVAIELGSVDISSEPDQSATQL